jgi:hypothetical protein
MSSLSFVGKSAFNESLEPATTKKAARWNATEDAQLRAAVQQYGDSDWLLVAKYGPPGRSNAQCFQRWNRSLKPGIKKGKWTADEDRLLSYLVSKHIKLTSDTASKHKDKDGIRWPALCKEMPGRTSKQCRERWFTHLDPSLNHGPFTANEDALLLSLTSEMGTNWSQIATKMKGRTADQVKVRMRSLSRQGKKQQTQSSVHSVKKEEMQQPPKRNHTKQLQIPAPLAPLKCQASASPTPLKRPLVNSQDLSGLQEWVVHGHKQRKIMNIDELLEGLKHDDNDSLFVADIEMLLNEAESDTNQLGQQKRVKGWSNFVVGTNNYSRNLCELAEINFTIALGIATDLSVQDKQLEGWCYFQLSMIKYRQSDFVSATHFGEKSKVLPAGRRGLNSSSVK